MIEDSHDLDLLPVLDQECAVAIELEFIQRFELRERGRSQRPNLCAGKARDGHARDQPARASHLPS